MTTKIKIRKPHAQKQQCSSPSLQPSRRCHTLAFFAAHLLLLSFIGFDTIGQHPIVPNPTPVGMTPNIQMGNSNSYPTGIPNYGNSSNQIHEQNMRLINETNRMIEEKANVDLETQPDLRQLSQMNYQTELKKHINSNYWKAYDKLKNMLEGKTEANLKQAVFEVEHAFNNTFTYEEFNKTLQQFVEIVKLKMEQDKTILSNSAINVAIAQVLSDTIILKIKHQENEITSYPIGYDFNDPWGIEDWNNMFVSKLLFNKKGNCHSMPLLYLIIAEELNADAYLSFSPNHSYIKFQHNNTMYNFETTQGVLVTDQWVMGSGYITTEAIKNKVFMDTLNKVQTIAHCLNDLAMGYTKIFGYSDTTFTNTCAELSLKYFNEGNIMARVVKSNNYLASVSMLGKQLGIKSREEAMNNLEIKKLWDKHDKEYRFIESTGYKTIPREKYDLWLQSAKANN